MVRLICIIGILVESAALSSQNVPPQNTSDGSWYLISATATNQGPEAYPVVLYKTTKDRKAVVVKTLVNDPDGCYEVLALDNGGVLIAYPHVTPKYAKVVSPQHPLSDTLVNLNPKAFPVVGSWVALASVSEKKTVGLFPLSSDTSDGPSLSQIAKIDASGATSTVEKGFPSDYRGLRYEGAPGGPSMPFDFKAKVRDAKVLVLESDPASELDRVPANMLQQLEGKTLNIVGASSRYFLFNVEQPADALTGDTRELFVHDRLSNSWKILKQPGGVSRTRLFGLWVATLKQNVIDPNVAPSPTELEVREETQLGETDDTKLNYDSYEGRSMSIPGDLILENLEDGRRIELDTRRQDSEILWTDGTIVLYRVNSRIYKSTLTKSGLSPARLIASGAGIESVHWIFPVQEPD